MFRVRVTFPTACRLLYWLISNAIFSPYWHKLAASEKVTDEIGFWLWRKRENAISLCIHNHITNDERKRNITFLKKGALKFA